METATKSWETGKATARAKPFFSLGNGKGNGNTKSVAFKTLLRAVVDKIGGGCTVSKYIFLKSFWFGVHTVTSEQYGKSEGDSDENHAYPKILKFIKVLYKLVK